MQFGRAPPGLGLVQIRSKPFGSVELPRLNFLERGEGDPVSRGGEPKCIEEVLEEREFGRAFDDQVDEVGIEAESLELFLQVLARIAAGLSRRFGRTGVIG